jgi:pimeloyl-ACP methyl ester carboxylesterase
MDVAFAIHGGDTAVGPFTVVLVHGWAGNRTYWDQQIGFLAEQHPVVALDLGGHGESGRGRADWNLPALGDDVVAVLDEVGASKVALIGHSMGGDAVVFAARRLGDRVVGIVWVDAFRSLGHEPVSPPEAVEAFLAPFRDDFAGAVDQFARSMPPPTADRSLVDRIAVDMAAAPRDVALGSLRYALNREPPLLDALAHVTAPLVAINPDIAPTDVDSLREHGVEPIVLEGVGHFLMLEDPQQFNLALKSTLASFESGSRRGP